MKVRSGMGNCSLGPIRGHQIDQACMCILRQTMYEATKVCHYQSCKLVFAHAESSKIKKKSVYRIYCTNTNSDHPAVIGNNVWKFKQSVMCGHDSRHSG